jgi:hypothetical protein
MNIKKKPAAARLYRVVVNNKREWLFSLNS